MDKISSLPRRGSRLDCRVPGRWFGVVHLRTIELSRLTGETSLADLFADAEDELKVVDGGRVVGVLLTPERAEQVAALEWLVADPERLQRALDAKLQDDARRADRRAAAY